MAKYNVGDKIKFLDWEYTLIKSSHSGYHYWKYAGGNNTVFILLNIDGKDFSKQVLNYYNSGNFPEMETLEDVEKLTDALLLECAKFRYPVGTTFNDEGNILNVSNSAHYWSFTKDRIWNAGGLGRLYFNGKWAEVVTEKKRVEKWSVGSYVVFLKDYGGNDKGTISKIAQKGNDGLITTTASFMGTSDPCRFYKEELKWFPTLQEAEAFSKELLDKVETRFEPSEEVLKVGDWVTIENNKLLEIGCRGCPEGTFKIVTTKSTNGLYGYDMGFNVDTLKRIWRISREGVRKATQEEINSVISPKEKNRVVNGVEMIKGEYYYCESNYNPSSYFVFIYDRHGTGKGNDGDINYIYTSQQVTNLRKQFGLKGINDAHHTNMRLATVMEREWLDACIKAGKYLELKDFIWEWDTSPFPKFEKFVVTLECKEPSHHSQGITIPKDLNPLTPKDCERNLTLSVDDEELPMVKPSKKIKVTNKLTIN